MTRYKEMMKQLNALSIPSDMKKTAWDYYKMGHEDGMKDYIDERRKQEAWHE